MTRNTMQSNGRKTSWGGKRLLAFLLAFAMIVHPMFTAVGSAYAEDAATEAPAAVEAPASADTQQPAAEPAQPAAPSEDVSSDTKSEEAQPSAPAEQKAEEPKATEPAAEEKENSDAEEEETEEFPAQNFTGTVNDLIVNVSAPKGALPAETKMTVTAVDLARVAKVAEQVVDGEVSKVKAANITFYNKEGKEIEPEKAVSVTMITSGLDTNADKAVVHIDDNWKAEKVNASITDKGTAKFQADDFSIYVVVEGDPDPDARLFVNFYEEDGKTLIATMSLTQNQITAGQTNVNIYDPGITLDAGEVFKGWTEKKDYSVDDAEDGMDISGVRSKATSMLQTNTVKDGDKIDLYAMVFKAYHVSYRDELAVTIHTDEVLFKKGDTNIPYTFQFAYTPYYVTGSDEDDETKAANFNGWKLMEPEVESPPVYDNGASINMADYAESLEETSLTLTVMAQVAYGHWLVFNGNGTGSSYTEPLFVATDKTPETAGMPTAPTRPGYTFDGWYTTAECTTEFDPTQAITQTTNVWAKWTENTEASFTVLIWDENLSGGYDFVRSIEIENAETGAVMAEAISGAVGDSTITVDGEDVFIPMTEDVTKANAGFTYQKYEASSEDGKVTSDGNSVLNVYFARREYTLKFYYARSQNGRYQVSQNYDAPTAHGSGSSTGGTWVPSGNQRPTTAPGCTFGGEGTETRGNYTYYYRTLTAKYGADISSAWPTYAQFSTFSNYRLGSWAIMHTSQAYIDDGQGTIKGKITVMDEHILGNLASADGNYVYANYDTASSQYDWIYNIYFEDANGTVTHGGKRYILQESVSARSHDPGTNWATQQHPPAYPGMEEVDRQRVGNNREINYYYAPLSYPILFKDGVYVDGDGHPIKNNNSNTLRALQDDDAIPYKSDVSEYNSYDPTSLISDGADYVFLGWYTDDQCNTKYTFDKMPIGGITVYAKWVLKGYKVVLHPNENGDSSFKYINGQPAGKYTGEHDYFWEDNGKKIGNVGGTRDLYDLIGWFTNENLSKVWDFDAFVLNDTIVSKYGELYKTDGSDSRYDPEYPGTVGEINLYASWRRILDGANGIDVIYTAVGKDGDGNEVVGTDAPEDPNEYSDQAQAIARPAAKAPEADPPLAFQYWVVQKWDGKEYTDTDQHVFPGDRFTVKYDDAREEDVPEDQQSAGGPTKTYTVQLRAQYGSAEDATPTHIYWYNNYTDSEAGIIKKNEPLAINQAVEIPAAPAREGYEFLGWAKAAETDADKTTWHYTYPDLGESDLLLIYNSGTKTYTHVHGGETKTATGVFADENTPYDGMYAVWKEIPHIELKATKTLTGRDWKEGETFTFTLSAEEGTPMPENKTVEFTANGEKSFEVIEFADATLDSEYVYTISEAADSLPTGVTKSADITATVTFADSDEDGTLEAVVAYTNNDTITNTYTPIPVDVDTDDPDGDPETADALATKTVAGEGFEETTFNFTITPVGEAPAPKSGETAVTTGSVKMSAVGSEAIDFGTITFTKAGTFTYKVQETNTATGGWSFDTAEKTVTIEVTDNNGKLEAKVTGVTIDNRYATTPAEIDTTDPDGNPDTADAFATKIVEGTGFKETTFSFNIAAATGSPEGTPLPTKTSGTVTAAAANSYPVDFGTVKYTKAGTYTYTVKETNAAANGWTFDTAEKTVTVEVTNNNGTLAATVTGVKITNKYAAKPAEIDTKDPDGNPDTADAFVTKTVVGSDFDPITFGFGLEANDGAPAPSVDADDIEVSQAGNTVVDFGTITFSEVGTYTYTAKELSEDAPIGWEFDTEDKTITVQVTDNGEGQLVTKVEGATFVNTYETPEVTVDTSDVEIGFAKKSVTGTGFAATPFNFTIVPNDGAPAPTGSAATVNATAAGDYVINFGTITFTEIGDYTYTVTETGTAPANWTFDTAPKTVTVTVSMNADGELEAEVVGNAITNSYTEPTPPVPPTPDPDPTPDPGPGPAPTPTPTITPITPTTPVATPALVPPAVITETPTPQATVEDEPTPQATIDEKAAPKAAPEDFWALINLLCTIATVLISALLLIFYFIKRKADDDEEEERSNSRASFMEDDDEEEAKRKNKLGMRLLGLIPAIGSVVAFILTEDMSAKMQMVDKWTIVMVIILAIEVLLAVFSKKTTEDGEEQGEAARA